MWAPMSATRKATVSAEDLPDILTVSELAAFERVDARTLRGDLDKGIVPGAYKRGRSWRISKRTYLDALASEGGR